jgi:hypothetical protein
MMQERAARKTGGGGERKETGGIVVGWESGAFPPPFFIAKWEGRSHLFEHI